MAKLGNEKPAKAMAKKGASHTSEPKRRGNNDTISFPKIADNETRSRSAKKSLPPGKAQNHVAHVAQVAILDLAQALDAEAEQASRDAERIKKAGITIDKVLVICHKQPEQLFSSEFTEAVRTLRTLSPGQWAEARVRIKSQKPSGVSLADIDQATAPHNDSDDARGSTASKVIELVTKKGELCFDEDSGKAYFTVEMKGGLTTLALDSLAFADWLSDAYYRFSASENAKGVCVNEQVIKQVRFTLSGMAKYDGIRQKVYLRTADSKGGHYLFIGNEAQQVIEVLPSGWQILDHSPVKFWQPRTMKPLPVPQKNGSISKLWEYVNVKDDDRLLVLAWLLESLRTETPNPILFLTGGQGCAKSSSQKRLRELIDHNAAPLRGAPKSVDDVFVAAENNWLVSLENMSNLSGPMQDALCVLATGGGFATRALYTNAEESVINVKRPIIMNGISHVITAQDLTDRSIQVELHRVDYIEEAVMNKKWAVDAPSIMGGLMDLFVKTLAQLPKVKLKKLPRMADFARLGEAMAQALESENGHFMSLYTANRSNSIGRAMESSPVAIALCEMVEQQQSRSPVVFHGTVKSLLDHLAQFKHDSDGWPKSAKGLGDALRRQLPALAECGIDVTFGDRTERIDGARGIPITIKLSGNIGKIGNVNTQKTTGKEKSCQKRY
jgi:hypothetical protein